MKEYSRGYSQHAGWLKPRAWFSRRFASGLTEEDALAESQLTESQLTEWQPQESHTKAETPESEAPPHAPDSAGSALYVCAPYAPFCDAAPIGRIDDAGGANRRAEPRVEGFNRWRDIL